MLSMPPDEIRLGVVVRLLEKDDPLVECLGPGVLCLYL